MSRSLFGRLVDSKGAELLAQLKAKLAPAKTSAVSPPPANQPSEDLGKYMTSQASASLPHLTPDAARAARKFKKQKSKNTKNQGITVIKVRNAVERALYRDAVSDLPSEQSGATKADAAAKGFDFGEAAFRNLAPLRNSLDGFAANHRALGDIPSADQQVITRRVQSGAESSASIVDRNDGYFLGYDFGTSTTKVVARDPYGLGGLDEAFAIDVPLSFASGGEDHLFPTAIYWNKDLDLFSLIPDEGYLLLDSFKAALIQGRGMRICNKSGLTMAEAATAFVTLHLAYCLGASLEERSDFKLASINVGIPVAVFDGQSNVALFDRVFSTATRLVAQAPHLSCVQLRAAFREIEEPALPYTRHAELAGAIAGYCTAIRFYIGGHMIIDCGSATLDIVTFDLNQQTQRPIGIYAACVENLGADACALYLLEGSSIEECREAARFEEHLVYRQTIKAKPNLFGQDGGTYPYQIILIGGGIHSDVHRGLLEKLSAAFEKPFHRPAIASTLRYSKACEAGRLILADGLARDPIDLRDIVLPKPPPPPSWTDPIAPGKEQV